MTKEITKAYILQQMQDKFGLRELTPEVFSFLETVVPIYNIEQHLQNAECTYAQQTISSTGGKIFFTVPDTEIWKIERYVVVPITGVYTFAGVYISRENSISNFAYLDLTAAQTIAYAVNLPYQVKLFPGDRLGINIDGYTSTGGLRLYIDYMKEEIR